MCIDCIVRCSTPCVLIWHTVDPAFRLMRSPLNGELYFYFEKRFNWLKKMTWSRHLFLFYFLKGKQNKKEKP